MRLHFQLNFRHGGINLELLLLLSEYFSLIGESSDPELSASLYFEYGKSLVEYIYFYLDGD